MNTELNNKTINGLSWSFAERILTQIMDFTIGIILARLLMPNDYGYVVITGTFISFASSIIKGGLSESLIRNKNADDTYFSTAIYAMTFLALVFLVGLYALAPLISTAYGIPEICGILRFYVLILPINALNEIQIAYFRKKMEFKKLFWASLPGTIAGGIAGIVWASKGGGAWALIAFFMIDKLVDTLIMFLQGGVSFRHPYSHEKMKELWSFGSKSLADNVINIYAIKISDMIFAAYKPSDVVAFQNRGKQYPYVIHLNTGEVINNALFPAMAQIQDDVEGLTSSSRLALKMTSFFMFPLMAGFGAVGAPLFSVVLTDKWLPAVPFLHVACIRYALWPYIACSDRILKVRGNMGKVLNAQVFSKIALFILLPLALKMEGIAYEFLWLFAWALWFVLISYYSFKEVGYGVAGQLKDTYGNIICTIIMLCAVILTGNMASTPIGKLAIQIPVGVAVYIAAAFFTKNENFIYVLDMIKKRKVRNHNNIK